jgi:enoyl-CoA hydratase/carnithine racemase
MNGTEPVTVERSDGVAVIKLASQANPHDTVGDMHWAVGAAFEELRWDKSVRVVVVTGAQDGQFLTTYSPDGYDSVTAGMRDTIGNWHNGNSAIRAHQALALIEKPVVARVNGDAHSFGQSLMFGCDIIVAWEDAHIADCHLGLGETVRSDGSLVGSRWGMVPGDGALAWLPSLMPATKAKEYLLLAKTYTARELADMNIVNYAVPHADLDPTVERIVGELMKRPAAAVAYTKRAINKSLVNQLNMLLDICDAYEKVNLYEHILSGFKNVADYR